MVEMTYEDMSSHLFLGALQKIIRAPLAGKTAYQIKKWSDEIQKARDGVAKEYMAEIGEKFGKKDDKGKLILDADGSFDIAEGQQDAAMAAQKEFGQRKVSIDRYKIWIHELNDVRGITAQELFALSPILTEDPHAAQVQQISG